MAGCCFRTAITPLLDEFRQQLREAEPFVLLGRPADPVTMNTGMTGAADGYYSVIGVPQSTGQPGALRPSAPYSFLWRCVFRCVAGAGCRGCA